MSRTSRVLLGVSGFVLKTGLLVGVAVCIAVLSLWNTVDRQFRESEVTVPDVRGLGLDEATARLAEHDLSPHVEARRPHESVEPGLVAWQDPVPGASTRRRRLVRITLSAGRQLAVVPDVVGKSRREATIHLRTEHVAVGQVIQVAALVPADTVIAQSPGAGAPLEEGGRIDLLVSTGPRRRAHVMPDLRGRSAAAAREALLLSGLRLAQERSLHEPGVAPGYVRGQDPAPGSRILPDEAVVLTVSSDAQPPVPPTP